MSDFVIEQCNSCRANVIWALTTRGKRMPVNAEPSPDGNIAIGPVTGRDGLPVARVLNTTQQFGRKDLRTSHFATCKDAASWRKRGRA